MNAISILLALFLVFVIFFVVIFRTNRYWKKRVSQLIQKSESDHDQSMKNINFLQNIIDHLEEGILLIDSKEKIIFSNSSVHGILDFNYHLIGMYYWEIVRNQDFNSHVKEAINSNSKGLGEYSLPSTTEKNISYQVMPLSDGHKAEEKRVLVVLSDITKLRKLERIRTDLVSNVSHELKSPLGAILGYTETLQDEGDKLSGENRKKFISIIHKNVTKLIAIVEDLLILSRVESNNRKDLDCFNPQEIIIEVVELYKEKIKDKKLRLTLALPEKPFMMKASKYQIRQVILNLLDNAIKYTNTSGLITISLSRENNNVVFIISDTGIGIPYHEQERIYERFFQVDRARQDSIKGSGLGLSIVKHVVDSHKGQIKLESQLNHGSTFKVIFPQNLTES